MEPRPQIGYSIPMTIKEAINNTAAAPETPRAFQIGDRVHVVREPWRCGVVVREPYQHENSGRLLRIDVRYDAGHVDWGHAHAYILITPVAPADPERIVETKPARPVPQWGDVVAWFTPDGAKELYHKGLVVPTDGNGNKPRSGYLWARRKYEGQTEYACVAVELCTIVERATDR